jgi:hypothetical protein
MNKSKLVILILVGLTLLPAACGSATAAEGMTVPLAGDGCPAETAETRVLRQPEHGYCLLYPVAYKVERPNEAETHLVMGSLLNVQDPRVSIATQKADGRTSGQFADELLASYQQFGIGRKTVMVDGVEAVVLDQLPGQEINRRVILVHEDWLYELTLTPADASLGAAFEGMETLYDTVIKSFLFIPTVAEPVEGQDCLDPKAGEQALTIGAYNFRVLHPDGYDVDEGTADQAALLVGSLQDVEHPKLFINVGDAQGRTAEQIAEGLAGGVQASMPGYEVERTFGLTLGYEPAWVLENMPGQEISRQVVAVHGDRLYTLAFIPADPGMGDVYEQMEALYELVVRSFRFLEK